MRRLIIAPLVLLAACSGPEEQPPEEPAATATQTALEPIPDYGLTRGVYSADSCPPALASVSTFDGRGFDTRNAMDCTFKATAQDGSTYSGIQSCLDSYSKEELVDRITIEVQDAVRFIRTDEANGSRAYRLCPDEELADWTAQPSAASPTASASRKAS